MWSKSGPKILAICSAPLLAPVLKSQRVLVQICNVSQIPAGLASGAHYAGTTYLLGVFCTGLLFAPFPAVSSRYNRVRLGVGVRVRVGVRIAQVRSGRGLYSIRSWAIFNQVVGYVA